MANPDAERRQRDQVGHGRRIRGVVDRHLRVRRAHVADGARRRPWMGSCVTTIANDERHGRVPVLRRHVEQVRVERRHREVDVVAPRRQLQSRAVSGDARGPIAVDPPRQPERERVRPAVVGEGRRHRSAVGDPLTVVAVRTERHQAVGPHVTRQIGDRHPGESREPLIGRGLEQRIRQRTGPAARHHLIHLERGVVVLAPDLEGERRIHRCQVHTGVEREGPALRACHGHLTARPPEHQPGTGGPGVGTGSGQGHHGYRERRSQQAAQGAAHRGHGFLPRRRAFGPRKPRRSSPRRASPRPGCEARRSCHHNATQHPAVLEPFGR